MSVTAQHLDYLRTALRTLDQSSENQYKIRGQPRADKVQNIYSAFISLYLTVINTFLSELTELNLVK